MVISDEALKTLLLENKTISAEKLTEASQFAQDEKISLYEAVLKRDLLLDSQLGQLVSDYLGIPYIELSTVDIDIDILQIIPEVVAKHQGTIAFKKDEKGVHVAFSDPTNLDIVEFLKKKVGIPLVIYFATEKDIANAISLYSKDVKIAFDDIMKENLQKAKGEEQEPSIVKIVDTIMLYAYQNKASDIHLEPTDEESLVRFRIDGVLHDIVKLPLEIYPEIVTKVKVLTNLRTDEHLVPQDGKIQYQTEKELLDIRVSVVPLAKGEKIVMRLLSENTRPITLSSLGFSENELKKVEKAYDKPYGMILATGPTGSGKTTTMYAIIRILNKRDVNIMTIEDPIEYDMEGVNQIQVNTKANLTFATGLRSILRQDPNIILVGEIRDKETAGIAVNSAMTGHLVLSTLHTNDAPTAIPRLFDMDIEPFLVASTINVIIAQRLVRRIHQVCRVSEEVETAKALADIGSNLVKKAFGPGKKIRLYKGKGCAVCHKTGYEGRVGIFETLAVDDDLKDAIMQKKDASQIRKIAIANGMHTMLEDGLDKVREGITTIDEVLRVTKE